MNPIWFQWAMAIILAVAAISLAGWFLSYKAGRSETRMMSMLLRAGVDPEVIEDGDHESIMRAVRKRCRKCQAEDVCEHWLAGSYKEDNLFCPNAHVFRSLAAEQKQAALGEN